MKKSHRSLRRRPLFTPVWLSLLSGVALLFAGGWVWNSLGTTTVILVRHAETVGDGPQRQLSPGGIERTAALAQMLENVSLSAVYVSELPRTRATGEIVAAATGAELIEMPAADAEELADRLRRRKGQTVLVVGHSNTLPVLIERLGGTPVAIDQDDHSQLLVLTTGWLERTRVLSLRYNP
ncbi:MAG: phosphoglycerate mutase family protein [Gammaproteobacteria bacterium]